MEKSWVAYVVFKGIVSKKYCPLQFCIWSLVNWEKNLILLRWCTVHRKWEREVQKWFIFELDNWLKWPLITSSALALLWQRILMPCFANGKNTLQWTFLVFLIFKYWSQGSSLWTKCLETTDNCSNYILPMQPCNTDRVIHTFSLLNSFTCKNTFFFFIRGCCLTQQYKLKRGIF